MFSCSKWQDCCFIKLKVPKRMHLWKVQSKVKLQYFMKSYARFHLLDLLVDNDANGMLGNIVHTSRLPMVAFMRHSFLNGTCALEWQSHNKMTQWQTNNNIVLIFLSVDQIIQIESLFRKQVMFDITCDNTFRSDIYNMQFWYTFCIKVREAVTG